MADNNFDGRDLPDDYDYRKESTPSHPADSTDPTTDRYDNADLYRTPSIHSHLIIHDEDDAPDTTPTDAPQAPSSDDLQSPSSPTPQSTPSDTPQSASSDPQSTPPTYPPRRYQPPQSLTIPSFPADYRAMHHVSPDEVPADYSSTDTRGRITPPQSSPTPTSSYDNDGPRDNVPPTYPPRRTTDHTQPSPDATPSSQTSPTRQYPPTPPQRPRRDEPQHKGVSWPAALVLMLLTVALSVGSVWVIDRYGSGGVLGASGAEVATQAPVVTAEPAGEANWATVAKTVRPSVVAISVSLAAGTETGSGVIFDKAGHILTNYHVIANYNSPGAQLVVQLSDGRLFRANVVGTDPTTDLAVLEIENPPSDLTMVTLGSSDKLTVGQQVAAIGNPLGLDNTMTVGIISALDRPVTVNQKVEGADPRSESVRVTTNAIQVDAAINPGNSGGPLFASDGTVIGINSSIASLSEDTDTAGSIGIGFAIPVNLAKKVADQILTKGSADHAFLGVRVSTDTVTVNGATRAGAKVHSVEPGGGADAAGLHRGDVIVKLNNHVVASDASLTGYVRWYLPGDHVTVTYVRDNKEHEVEAVLGSSD